ncbi:MAG: hypothetical protein N2572_03530 [Syntrophales bacterium]|nr:hypothetical protein [Syntrophales bacterium]
MKKKREQNDEYDCYLIRGLAGTIYETYVPKKFATGRWERKGGGAKTFDIVRLRRYKTITT